MRIFGPPRLLPPPIGSIFQKSEKNQNRLRMALNGKKLKKKIAPWGPPPQKIRIDSEWPETVRNQKKKICPLVTPPPPENQNRLRTA